MQDRVSVNKLMAAAAAVIIIQVAVVLVILLYMYLEGKPELLKIGIGDIRLFLYVIILTVLLNCFLMFRYTRLIFSGSRHSQALYESNAQLEHLNHTLRSQRHDFMNHLQVVHSLIEMDEFGDARDYIERVYDDIQKVNNVLRTSNAAVNALLQAKIIYAEKLGINLEVSIKTSLKQLRIPSWEFCKVLGNLIDNAVFALQETKGNQHLSIELHEDLKNHSFVVANNGPAIPSEVLERIFDSGFTTKGDKGNGMGLAIVKETLQQYGGSIEVKSTDTLTEFRGTVPKER